MEEDLDENGTSMAGGTLAAIIIVILAIFAAIGITFWAKRSNKWCFKDYNPAKTDDPDTNVNSNSTPIVKSPKNPVQEEKPKEQV